MNGKTKEILMNLAPAEELDGTAGQRLNSVGSAHSERRRLVPRGPVQGRSPTADPGSRPAPAAAAAAAVATAGAVTPRKQTPASLPPPPLLLLLLLPPPSRGSAYTAVGNPAGCDRLRVRVARHRGGKLLSVVHRRRGDCRPRSPQSPRSAARPCAGEYRISLIHC